MNRWRKKITRSRDCSLGCSIARPKRLPTQLSGDTIQGVILPGARLSFAAGQIMVARDGVEPPTPAFSEPWFRVLTTLYKPPRTALVRRNSCKTETSQV